MKSNLLFLIITVTLFTSCSKKDKFECGVESNSPPTEDSSILFIPTAFSPYQDGLNDQFLITTININSTHIEIYNNENELLFETDEWKGWAPNTETGLTLYHYKVTAKSLQGYEYYRCGDVYSFKCLTKGFDANKLIFGDQFDPTQPGYYLPGTSAEIIENCK
ncbi:T9SS type B sorting domain-containing protein [Taibaiella lutea]|nr:gliding motility-associated C-terminal domain-containing protein [Taibaiella lutea]